MQNEKRETKKEQINFLKAELKKEKLFRSIAEEAVSDIEDENQELYAELEQERIKRQFFRDMESPFTTDNEQIVDGVFYAHKKVTDLLTEDGADLYARILDNAIRQVTLNSELDATRAVLLLSLTK